MSLNLIGIFGVRNDSSRGILIETILAPNGTTYFFKFCDQPLARHCEQVQNIIRKAQVKRAKKIQVDLAPFINEYWCSLTETVEFKGVKLNSDDSQLLKLHQMKINKEIGAAKRAITIAANKQTKIAEKNRKIIEKAQADEQRFQALRIQRIHEVFGPQVSGTGRQGSGQEVEVTAQHRVDDAQDAELPSDSDEMI